MILGSTPRFIYLVLLAEEWLHHVVSEGEVPRRVQDVDGPEPERHALLLNVLMQGSKVAMKMLFVFNGVFIIFKPIYRVRVIHLAG